jgi:hypothetical protein
MPHGHGLTDFLYQRDGEIIAFARPDLAVAGWVCRLRRRWSIPPVFLLEYVPVSGISVVDDQTSSRLIGVGSL